jgi:hypothetical protein
MSWTKLLAERRVVAEPATPQEIDDLRQVVDRNLQDARAAGLSDDGRFNFAYSAARTLTTIVVRACGYRVKGTGGGHYNTFQALESADDAFANLAAYFDTCRVMRNESSYDEAGVVSVTDADELVREAGEFKKIVQQWLKSRHPDLAWVD